MLRRQQQLLQTRQLILDNSNCAFTAVQEHVLEHFATLNHLPFHVFMCLRT